MNDDDAMSYFLSQGRRPSFDARGKVRGGRSRPGAPQANPARNLPMSEPSGTPDSAWNRLFPNTARPGAGATGGTPSGVFPTPSETNPYVRFAMPESEGGDRQEAAGAMPSGGIAAQTIDTAFGAGHWNKLTGLGPRAAPAPSLYSPAPFMPGQQGDKFTVPKPLTGPMGSRASDRVALAGNLAMNAPGGMSGLWSRQAAPRPAEKWQGAALKRPASAYTDARYTTPYGPASVNFAGAMNRQPKLPASTRNYLKDRIG